MSIILLIVSCHHTLFHLKLKLSRLRIYKISLLNTKYSWKLKIEYKVRKVTVINYTFVKFLNFQIIHSNFTNGTLIWWCYRPEISIPQNKNGYSSRKSTVTAALLMKHPRWCLVQMIAPYFLLVSKSTT